MINIINVFIQFQKEKKLFFDTNTVFSLILDNIEHAFPDIATQIIF